MLTKERSAVKPGTDRLGIDAEESLISFAVQPVLTQRFWRVWRSGWSSRSGPIPGLGAAERICRSGLRPAEVFRCAAVIPASPSGSPAAGTAVWAGGAAQCHRFGREARAAGSGGDCAGAGVARARVRAAVAPRSRRDRTGLLDFDLGLPIQSSSTV